MHYDDPSLQRSQFRRQLLNPFRTERKEDVELTLDNNKLSSIFSEVITKFSEYFFTQLSTSELSSKDKSVIDWYFEQAIEETNSLYILAAYTTATNFYAVLNKGLAKFALKYFDAILQESTKYKAVAAIIDFISLLIHDPALDKYDYRGKTYRGMLFEKKDFLKYVVGSKLMNISFVSTSKDRNVAEIFAGGVETNLITKASEHSCTQISALCIYMISNARTGLDIEGISQISAEREVLLLPFSAFRIRCIREMDKTVNNGIAVELELEECEEHHVESARKKQVRILTHLLRQQQQNNESSMR
ncbi:unnamed protein product [Adineta steineri]|uniref:NAD(+)--protein-arginine ADP-ribosyltransferase n=1 Tax=Adineta steineri TaxID=433720 RepID=A0A815RGU1_9BILA|nr:unnamed protein product [Adineta steineri]CAF3709992.1 unnamed protein product [Adineta steineri]